MTCRSCGSRSLRLILDLGSSPLADAFPVSADEPQDRYPLTLYVCGSCSLVQLGYTVPDATLYGAGYGFRSGSSPALVRYFAEYAEWVQRHLGRWADHGILEVASNDGTLLSQLAGHGFDVLGVEPSCAADDATAPTIKMPFAPNAVRAVLASRPRGVGLVVANNVIAHVAYPVDFVRSIEGVLRGDGRAVIECQYLPDLLLGNEFDHVYHEHRSYFSLTSLDSLLRRGGLMALGVIQTPAQGGSIRVVAGRLGEEPDDSVPALLRREEWLRDPHALDGLQGRADRLRDRLLALLREERKQDRHVVGWAAAAKATTLLNFCGIDRSLVEAVEDMTPAKIGRFMPGTDIPIVGSAYADTYLLLAWNYLPAFLHSVFPMRAIVPIPAPVVL